MSPGALPLPPKSALLKLAVRSALGRRVTKAQVAAAFKAIDVVLDAVRAEVTPVVEREWCGVEVLKRIEKLRR